MENEENTNIEETTNVIEEITEETEQDNVQTLINDVKAQYEEKLLKQRNQYEKRVQERDAVIKQLLAGDNENEEKDIIQLRIEMLNEKRALQNKKW